MHSYTATIGRGFYSDGTCLSLDDWESFKNDTLKALTWYKFNDDVIETSTGTGVWEGKREDNYKVTLLTNIPMYESGSLVDLKIDLKKLAVKYNQDAIALTIGRSELITS